MVNKGIYVKRIVYISLECMGKWRDRRDTWRSRVCIAYFVTVLRIYK